MIARLIRWSIGNRFFVLLATAILVGTGMYSLKNTPVDAIPDLSDVQVIIKTSYPGQAPQLVQDHRQQIQQCILVGHQRFLLGAALT